MKSILIFSITMLTVLNIAAQDKGFVHTATTSNITEHVTVIDHPELNGNPSAYFLYSQRYNETSNPNPTGIFYNGSNWTIYNENFHPMPVGQQFNIYIPDDSPVDVVVSDVSNTSNHILDLQGYNVANFLFYNNYYNPNGIVNPFVYGNYYDTTSSTRKIYEENFNAIPSGAAFIVMRGVSESASLFSINSSSSNTQGNGLLIDNPLLNNNPDAVFVFSHYWGYPTGNETYLPHIIEARYIPSIDKWSIYFYGGTFPENVTIDYIVPGEVLGVEGHANAVSKITIYPNPVIDNVSISSSKMPIQAIEIYDMSGKLVYSSQQTGKTISLLISELPTGLYMAKTKTEEGWFTQKLIKK